MTTQIKEYSAIEAGISALAAQYDVVPDCATDGGLKHCKKQYREIRKVETALEKERKTQGDQARLHLNLVNSEAKLIDSRLKEISSPFKYAFEQRDFEIKQAEDKRVGDIKARIDQLGGFIAEAHNLNSEGVTGIIEAIDMIDCAEGFEEFTQEALKTKQHVVDQLGTLLQQKIQNETAERERQEAQAELDKMRAAMAELKRQSEPVVLTPKADIPDNAPAPYRPGYMEPQAPCLIDQVAEWADKHGVSLEATAELEQIIGRFL